jgi:hypothetical protein
MGAILAGCRPVPVASVTAADGTTELDLDSISQDDTPAR